MRRQAVDGSGRGSRLVVFLRQGMRAWIEQELRSAAETSVPPRTFDSVGLCPQPLPAEAVLLLAAMALGARQEYVC